MLQSSSPNKAKLKPRNTAVLFAVLGLLSEFGCSCSRHYFYDNCLSFFFLVRCSASKQENIFRILVFIALPTRRAISSFFPKPFPRLLRPIREAKFRLNMTLFAAAADLYISSRKRQKLFRVFSAIRVDDDDEALS